MECLRTPDGRFDNLPGYNFEPHYLMVDDTEGGEFRVHYLDETYKKGARQFPLLVPISPDNPASEKNRAAWAVLSEWNKPFVTATT